MTSGQNIIEASLLHQILFNFVRIWGGTRAALQGIFLSALKSGLETECTIKAFDFFRLWIIVAWTQILESNCFNIKRVQNVTSLPNVFVGFTEGAFILQLLDIKW